MRGEWVREDVGEGVALFEVFELLGLGLLGDGGVGLDDCVVEEALVEEFVALGEKLRELLFVCLLLDFILLADEPEGVLPPGDDQLVAIPSIFRVQDLFLEILVPSVGLAPEAGVVEVVRIAEDHPALGPARVRELGAARCCEDVEVLELFLGIRTDGYLFEVEEEAVDIDPGLEKRLGVVLILLLLELIVEEHIRSDIRVVQNEILLLQSSLVAVPEHLPLEMRRGDLPSG